MERLTALLPSCLSVSSVPTAQAVRIQDASIPKADWTATETASTTPMPMGSVTRMTLALAPMTPAMSAMALAKCTHAGVLKFLLETATAMETSSTHSMFAGERAWQIQTMMESVTMWIPV